MDQTENISDNITKQNVDAPQSNQTFFTKYKNIIIITIAVIIFLILCCIMSFALLVGLIRNTGTLVIDENTSSNSAVTSMITATSFSTSNNSATQSSVATSSENTNSNSQSASTTSVNSQNTSTKDYSSKYFQYNNFKDSYISLKYPTGYKVVMTPENHSYKNVPTAYDNVVSFDGIDSIRITNGKEGYNEHAVIMSVASLKDISVFDSSGAIGTLWDIRVHDYKWRVYNEDADEVKYYKYEELGTLKLPELGKELTLVKFENGQTRVIALNPYETLIDFVAKGRELELYDPENPIGANLILFKTGKFSTSSFLGGNGNITNKQTGVKYEAKFDPNDPKNDAEVEVSIGCGDIKLETFEAMVKCVDPARALANTAVRYK